MTASPYLVVEAHVHAAVEHDVLSSDSDENTATTDIYTETGLRIDYGDDGAKHALVHSNLSSSALDYDN